MASLFGPDYGAAQTHINELMAEREDFIAANVSQAQVITELRKQVKNLTEDLETCSEQLSVQTLIAESRARQLEEARLREEEQAMKADKLRSSVRVLWGMHQEMLMRLRDQQESVAAGNELLETLSELLADPGKQESAKREQ
jgi:hypothetical protein